VNYPSTSANCGGRARVGATDSRSRFSRELDKNPRPASRGSASYRSRRFVRVRPEGQEWETLQEMFLTSRSRFIGLAYAILRNREDAEDAVQDALLSAYLHLRSFEGRSSFTTWFTRIVLNAALMIRRKQKNSRTDSLPESCAADGTPWTEKIPASQPDPEMVYAGEETCQWIDVLLRRMSPVLRQAFTMTYYDEMSHEEAGALLGIATGTFKSRVFRARQHLMNHAQRALVAPIRRPDSSSFFPDRSAVQHLVARPVDTSSLEASHS
jgi:RNA polymerase sigma-70 factor, ECF subfamily